MAEGVPAGRGDPVEGISESCDLRSRAAGFLVGGFLGPVPATTSGRQADPAEESAGGDKVRGDAATSGSRAARPPRTRRWPRRCPPERQGTAPVEQEVPSLAGGHAGDECFEVGAATERVEVGVLVNLTAVLVAGGQGLP